MMHDKHLTNFQIILRDRIISLINSMGRRIEFSKRGSQEVYLYARHDEFEIWIYEDEAEFRFQERKFLHETHTDISEKDLIENFMNSLRSSLMHMAKTTNQMPRKDSTNNNASCA